MSLNGLDAVPVNEAYQSALAEGGRWFLLKYQSRDEVEILHQGAGGLAEVQDTIRSYEEQSPLYGLIHYRRRKVVLKFVPEGTSRLIKARVTVHFQSVTERLSPYDSVFEFTTVSELRDSALSSACSLHTASGSLKSSSDSPPPRGLAGITEDALEPDLDNVLNGNRANEQGEKAPSSSRDDAQARHEKATEILNTFQSHKRLSSPAPSHQTSHTSNTEKELPPTPPATKNDEAGPSSEYGVSIHDSTTPELSAGIEQRNSSLSVRPTSKDLHRAYEYKPKVKLGPRPSMDANWRSDNSDLRDDFRPVSTLPAGLRMPPRKSTPSRPMSSQSHVSSISRVPVANLRAPPTTTMKDKPSTSPVKVSPGLPAIAKTPENKTPKMTPEKRKLMKALQLRQKQMAAQSPVQEDVRSPVADLEHVQSQATESTSPLLEKGPGDIHNVSIMHVNANEPVPEVTHNVQDSPISILEPSEGHSTKASSVTDDDVMIEDKCGEDGSEGTPTKTADSQSVIGAPEEGLRVGTDGLEDVLPSVVEATDVISKGEQASSHHFDMIEGNEESEPCTHHELTHDGDISTGAEHIVSRPSTSAETPTDPEDGRTGPSEIEPSSPNRINSSISRPQSQFVAKPRPTTVVIDAPAPQAVETRAIEVPAMEEPSSARHLSWQACSRISREGTPPNELPLRSLEDKEALAPSRPSSLSTKTSIASVSQGTRPNSSSSKENKETVKRTSEGDSIGESSPKRKIRRRGMVNPTEQITNPDTSDEIFLSDDKFMEELKCATLQQAKPVSVSKSPVKPVISRNNSEQPYSEILRQSRTVSSPLKIDNKDASILSPPHFQSTSSLRSISASHPTPPQPQPSSAPLPKKLGVSSGISQRIKALEQLSSRPTSPVITSPTTTTTFINLRRSSIKDSPTISDPNPGPSRSPPGTDDPSPSTSPKILFPNSMDQINKPPAESISVTATIIRDDSSKPLDTPQGLVKSPLLVEHQVMGPPSLPPLKPPRPRYARYSSARSGSSSSTDLRNEHPPSPRRDSIASGRSLSSLHGSDIDLPRSTSDKSINLISGLDGSREDRKDSRRSRLLKRMSSISSMSRRSIAQALSPGPKEASIVEYHEPVASTASSSVIDLGDLNIQFPDTLLWRRRHMLVDDTGVLILSAAKSDNNPKVTTKRFPLSDLRPPYIPDQDRQELANSVFIDFIDGSTLQCASEHPQGQAHILKSLRQAHSLHQS